MVVEEATEDDASAVNMAAVTVGAYVQTDESDDLRILINQDLIDREVLAQQLSQWEEQSIQERGRRAVRTAETAPMSMAENEWRCTVCYRISVPLQNLSCPHCKGLNTMALKDGTYFMLYE